MLGVTAGMPAHAYYEMCRAPAPEPWPAAAGDAIAAQIEAGRLSAPAQGFVQGMSYSAVGPIVHANFPQIIEQNFAAMGPKAMGDFFASIGQNEMSDLAQLYVNATEGTRKQGRLLDLLAARATPAQLGRLSEHFGYARVEAAVGRQAPSKLSALGRYGSRINVGPAVGEHRFGPQGRFSSSGGALRAGSQDISYLDWTPYEIYLDFRTAPVGSLGVAGALFETALTINKYAYPAWQVGWAVGTGLAGLIQTYSPSTWDAIGGTIDQALQNLSNLFSSNDVNMIGQAQSTFAGTFPLPNITTDRITLTGGDYGIAYQWSSWSGAGGLDSCH